MENAGVQNGATTPGAVKTDQPSVPAVVGDPKPEPVSTAKPVNPLRLARPLEKGTTGPGLSKTSIPPTRPMPMPTISPLCPPGSNQGKNGGTAASAPGKNPPAGTCAKNGTVTSSEMSASTKTSTEAATPASQPLKANPPLETPPSTPSEKEGRLEEPSPKLQDAKPSKDRPVLVPPKKSLSPIPSNAAPPKKETTPVTTKDALKSPPKKSSEAQGPKVPVAEKTPRQTKRKKELQDLEPGDAGEATRLSKRARAPPSVYEAPDPEMDQILKSIKKMEADKSDSKSASEKEDEVPIEKPTNPKAKNLPNKKPKRKKEESESEIEEPAELDKPKKRGRKPVSAKKAKAATSKKNDPVFFKDEFLAVRNADDGFYLCKAMQNIFMGSRNIKIQWMSNEDSVVPVKDNPDNDIYAPDFYDKTDFETILTSVDLEKTLGQKSKRMILPEEELDRINKILQRANDKAAGKLDLSNLQLTEDNPDGLDISLYKGEDQLDEIEKRRKDEEKQTKPKKLIEKVEKVVKNKEKVDKKKESKEDPKIEDDSADKQELKKPGRGRPKKEPKVELTKEEKETNEKVEEDTENYIEKEAESEKETVKIDEKEAEEENDGEEIKNETNLPVEKVTEEEAPQPVEDTRKTERRRATKNVCYDQFDFLEEEDDEVMPLPKKRKSQDSITESSKEDEVTKTEDVQNKEEEKVEEPIVEEELSTSEKALLAEKAKMEADAKQKEDEDEKPSSSEAAQPVKKRGRKPKQKE